MAFKALVCVGLLCLAVTTVTAGGTYVKNTGDVHTKQYQWQDAGNFAGWNSGPVNQQSSNQAIQQAGNGNYAENSNSQKNTGRKLLGGDWYWIDNSGDVWAKQGQFQSSGNYAGGNSGPVNQQSSNQAIQQAGNGNDAGNYNQQTIKGPQPPKPAHQGRKLLGDWYWIDNSGDVWAKQKQYQSSGNYAGGNSGPVNQQSSNQAIQQAGNGNSAGNYNQQTIKGPEPPKSPKGRKLLGGDSYWIDNSGDVWAKQGQYQSSGNSAYYNSGPVNQQSSNQAIQQAGNGNSAENYNKQTIKGPEPLKPVPPKPVGGPKRKLLGDWYWIDNSGDVWAKQKQFQSSGNFAGWNSGPVNQQSSNQAIQQAGNGNSAGNYNQQTIKG